jgi:hypothetical protein
MHQWAELNKGGKTLGQRRESGSKMAEAKYGNEVS